MMKLDCHMHTPLCGHAVGKSVEYVHMAAHQDIGLITFTCHIPMEHEGFGGPGMRMDHSQLPDYIAMVEAAQKEGQKLGVEVLCGIEAEVFPDKSVMAAMDRTLAKYGFDFVLGSLHHPLSRYRQCLSDKDIKDDFSRVETYFLHLTEGVRSGRYHSMAHPDVIRIYGTVQHFDPLMHEETIRYFLTAVAEEDICIEVNTSGLIKEAFELHPDPLILDWAAEMGVKLTLGSDSHHPTSVGQKFGEVIPMLKEKGFTHLHYFCKGNCVAVPLG